MKINLKKLLNGIRQNSKQGDYSVWKDSPLLRSQRKVGDYLNAKTAGWSTQKTKFIFIVFFLLSGNVILFITARSLLYGNGPPKHVNVQRLFTPPPFPVPGMKMPPDADSTKLNNHKR